jgi:hypothetical protein
VGHIAPACEKIKTTTKVVEESGESDVDEQETEEGHFCSNLQIKAVKNLTKEARQPKKKLTVQVKLGRGTETFQVDTGSGVSLIGKGKFEALFPQVQLRPSDLILRTYTKEVVRVTGMTDVEIKLLDQTRICRLYVVKGNHDSIFGLDWIRSFKLNWEELLGEAAVQQLNIKERQLRLEQLMANLKKNISGWSRQD